MRLGTLLGQQGQEELGKAVARQQQALEKKRRKAREAERNRKRSRGELIRYSKEDLNAQATPAGANGATMPLSQYTRRSRQVH